MGKENPKIGLDNVVIAKLKSDTEFGIEYASPIHLRGAVRASVNPNSDVAVDYGDNRAIFVSNNRGNTEMALEFTGIDPDIKANMLGQKKVNGITLESPMDQAPYFALGFRVWIGGTDENGNKIYENFWYAKGKFSVPETGGTTKKDSMEFQHDSMTAQFVSTEFSPTGDNIGAICTHCRTDDADVSPTVIANWFNQPVVSMNVDLGAVAVTASISSSTVTITGSKNGGGQFNFSEPSVILGKSIIVTDSDGDILSGVATVGEPGVSPTITITCDGTPANVVVTNELKDSNGVSVTPMFHSNI